MNEQKKKTYKIFKNLQECIWNYDGLKYFENIV